MKNSTGVVMQIEKSHAFIMTNSGEFLKLKLGSTIPNIGEVYTGELAKEKFFYKYAAAAASLLFVLFSGSASYAYYTPTASVLVNINPSIELKINRWDRIIKTSALNDDGKIVLASLNIKNKSINDGLDLIVDEAKKDNFINDNYVESGKVITVSIEGNTLNKDINLSSFEEHVKKNNLKVMIAKPGSGVKDAPKKSDIKSDNTNISPEKSSEDKNNKSENKGNDSTNPTDKESTKTGNPSNNSNDKNKNKEINNSMNSAPALDAGIPEDNDKEIKSFKGNSSKNSKDKINHKDIDKWTDNNSKR